jgi:hypothetical protein
VGGGGTAYEEGWERTFGKPAPTPTAAGQLCTCGHLEPAHKEHDLSMLSPCSECACIRYVSARKR